MPTTIVPATLSRWEDHPDYKQACRWQRVHGDPHSYTTPHPPGEDSTDVTDFKVGWASWSESNLPSILYQLHPCKAWEDFKHSPKPGPMKDAAGKPILESYPRAGEEPKELLDYEILRGLDRISTSE